MHGHYLSDVSGVPMIEDGCRLVVIHCPYVGCGHTASATKEGPAVVAITQHIMAAHHAQAA